MRNLHVVGCPRSGTTLLTEMLIASYDFQGHCEHEQTIFKTPVEGFDLYLSKKPNDVLWIEPLLARDPDLHVIALLRDPRSVICSIHSGHPGMYFCNYPVWKRAERALSRISEHPRLLLVRYEDLVAQPDVVQDRISRHFPFLRKTGCFSDFHRRASSSEDARRALGGVREVDETRVAGWRGHLPRLKQQVTRYPALADDLIRYGYEAGHDWLQMLAEVRPEVFPCRYSDRSEWLKHLEQRLRFRRKVSRYLKARGLERTP